MSNGRLHLTHINECFIACLLKPQLLERNYSQYSSLQNSLKTTINSILVLCVIKALIQRNCFLCVCVCVRERGLNKESLYLFEDAKVLDQYFTVRVKRVGREENLRDFLKVHTFSLCMFYSNLLTLSNHNKTTFASQGLTSKETLTVITRQCFKKKTVFLISSSKLLNILSLLTHGGVYTLNGLGLVMKRYFCS